MSKKQMIALVAAMILALHGSIKICEAADLTKDIKRDMAESTQSEWRTKLVGKWKVTEFITGTTGPQLTYDFYDIYLGRSIEIGPTRTVVSMHYWPEGIDYAAFFNAQPDSQEWDVEIFGHQKGNLFEDTWFERYQGQKMQAVSLGPREYYLMDNGDVLCKNNSNVYRLEPYLEAATNLESEELLGQWQVKHLVSYQDNWQVSRSLMEGLENGLGYEQMMEGLEADEAHGADFAPEEFYGDRITLSEDKMLHHRGKDLMEERGINVYTPQTVDIYQYQNEKRIHDELGISNEQIQVFHAESENNAANGLWDGDIVVVDKNKIIMKLYQGWFLLERAEEGETE